MIKLYKLLFKAIISTIKFKLRLKSDVIVVDGYKISYIYNLKPNRETLVFVHGLNDSKETWFELFKELRGKYNLIAIDLLGCGESSKPRDFEYSVHNQAEFFVKVFNSIKKRHNIKNFNLVGHSMGGGIVMVASLKLKPKKLILLAPLAINIKEPYIQKLARELGGIDNVPFLNVCSIEKLNSLIDILYHKKPYIPNFVKKILIDIKCKESAFETKIVYDLVDKDTIEFKENLTEVAKSLNIPTLIVWGKYDKVLDIANAEVLHQLIKNSKLKIYSCGHMLQAEVSKKIAKEII